MFFDRFHFVDPGPLIDGDLELVAPDICLIDEYLEACAHPDTQLYAPADAAVTREQLLNFLNAAPAGREPGGAITSGKVPQYHYWMRVRAESWRAPGSPSIRVVGAIGLRIGSTAQIRLYYGNVGYHVYPPARGRHYAERACRLLLPLARLHRLRRLWITCNPDNAASRRTCERLGAACVETVAVPPDNPLYARGEYAKCRYRLDLRR